MYKFTDVTYKHILQIDELHIKQGELTVLVGESGSGKTTLLRLLNRMRSHSSGLLLYKGTSISGVEPVALRRQAVMMPQNAPQEGANIGEALQTAFVYSEKPYCGDFKALEALRALGIDKALDTPLVNLSGGEWQRIALCRALLLNSKILLLDEPTSALDADSARVVMTYLSKLKGTRTIVIVSHAAELAREFADTFISMKDGKIVEVSSND